MAEDSGAFKTNQRNSAGFRHFVMTGSGVASKPHRIKKAFNHPSRASAPRICNKRHRYPAVFSNRPDSLRRRCLLRRERGQFCGHRVPDSSRPSQTSLRRRNSPFHVPKFPFSVRRDRVPNVDTGLRAWRGGATAHRS